MALAPPRAGSGGPTSDFLFKTELNSDLRKLLPSRNSQLPEHKSLHMENKTTAVTSALDMLP